jgi:mRNA interferase RelE/StbE
VNEYSITVASSAKKELEALEENVFDRVDPRIRALGQDPRPAGCKKLKGKTNIWRIRVGDYRIVYSIDNVLRAVTVLRVAHRSNV